ncbi:sigma-54-dependent Fis family transcriptional regulator [Candidatus Sumerlaeota bacterium]|nr:sigma-54-dependent Fis family transcriptional regulator [Candidatus Sumerlaeota bacterium]
MPRLLIVDSEQDVFYCFERLFANEDLDVVAANSGQEAVRLCEQLQPEVVLMDVELPGDYDGFEALKRIRAKRPRQLVILMAAYGTSQTAIEAMKSGAYDYIIKPFDVNQARRMIRQAIKAHQDMQQVVSYQPLLSREQHTQGIIGQSDKMQAIFKRIGQLAQNDLPVLITGESGTGKELVARAIYHHCPRKNKPFLALNCAAIPDTLLESELFGYEKGAFTGALGRKPGKIELCDGGTLFLDEIGDMPLQTQTKMLRVLQEGTFERVGGSSTIHVDVRFVAATNQDLKTMITEGRFREDLFYRLNVLPVQLPPLRERLDDVPLLTEYFLGKMKEHSPSAANSISIEAMEHLLNYGWPGNVRELENVIKNAALTAAGDTIVSRDLMILDKEAEPLTPTIEPRQTAFQTESPIASGEPGAIEDVLEPAFRALLERRRSDRDYKPMDEIERVMLIKALQTTNGNQARAAKLLNINRVTLRKRMEKYNVRIEARVEADF